MTQQGKRVDFHTEFNNQKRRIAQLERKLADLEEANIDLEAHVHLLERELHTTTSFYEGFILPEQIPEVFGMDEEEFHKRLDIKAAEGLRYIHRDQELPIPLPPPLDPDFPLELIDDVQLVEFPKRLTKQGGKDVDIHTI
ncbi:MAG TPA: hypothetical protein DCE42_02340 [Myxococcales bacterium]|nr:hypothetical protein [Deltaproteobacteria bacterium]MBK07325.1 hypothetical protein [Deltaproteobacteria bacterium]MBU53257.1 hypothetical protein [Deltaproteobacteria bacterium]HAA53563.1 hypothetical protein [Myxococcales bacterium]|tara:strand:+ start:16438 stop:16857 length:420 start_codon:yes stop_codon:yes gene_type:complete